MSSRMNAMFDGLSSTYTTLCRRGTGRQGRRRGAARVDVAARLARDRMVNRHLDPELGAAPDLAREADRAVHQLGEPLADREPDARCPRSGRSPDRRAGTARRSCRACRPGMPMPSSTTVIRTRAAVDAAVLNVDVAARLAVLDRVRAEVHQDLRQPRAIGDDVRQLAPRRRDAMRDLRARAPSARASLTTSAMHLA